MFNKKVFSLLLTSQFLSFQVLADVPRLPREPDPADPSKERIVPFTDYSKLNDQQKAQFGAFMLFYELVQAKKIGGDTGLCLSYKAGGNGIPDKISIGLDSKSYPTGAYSLDQVPVDKLNNLKGLLKEIGGYLDSGCKDMTPAKCKEGRSVNITGYADGQNYGTKRIQDAKSGDKASLVEGSIKKNIELSKNRAQMFSQIVTGEGFVSPNAIGVRGEVSPIGEYIQHGLPVPQKYLSEDQKKLPNGGFNLNNLKIDCKERRVTVIDINFNGQKADVNTKSGSMSPMLRSASKAFVKRTNMGASVQVWKAWEELNKSGKTPGLKTDKDYDVIIDKMLEMNGVKDPIQKAACKNTSTRAVVKDHLATINNLSAESKKKLSSTSEKDLLKMAAFTTRDKNKYFDNKEIIDYFNGLNDGYGGSQQLAKNTLFSDGSGLSTSLSDCFSAKAAMQLEFNDYNAAAEKNKSLPASSQKQLGESLCQPVADHVDNSGNLKIDFDPKELHDHKVLHIGCQNCQTGFRYVPQKYTNPETKKEETQMVPVFIDREAAIKDKENPILSTYRPVEPKELDKMITTVKAMEKKTTEMLATAINNQTSAKAGADKIKATAVRRFIDGLNRMSKGMNTWETLGIELNPSNPKQPGTFFTMKHVDHPKFQELLKESGVTLEEVKQASRVATLMNKAPYGALEQNYVNNRMKGIQNADTKRYEEVILPNIKARDALTNWNGENQESSSSMLFGSFKKPRYYILENCDCASDNLIEQAEKNGKAITLGKIPAKERKELVSKNACMISMPLPPSCMVNPNEKGTNTNTTEPVGDIQWMGLDGKNMKRLMSDMNQHFIDSNKAVPLKGCENINALDIAEKIVSSAECSGENKLPQGEGIDCKK